MEICGSFSYMLGLAFLTALLGWLLWRWNEIRYVNPIKARLNSDTVIPPGHLGFPLLGELLTFLWYFKVLRRPDNFITSKRYKYGDNVGVYRSYLFGSPSIIVCCPSLCKLVLQSTDKFKQEWPTVEALGSNSVITIQGQRHAMIKGFLVKAISNPTALARIVAQVQPTVVSAFESWSRKGKITAMDEVKKVTLEYMGKYVAHLEPGHEELDALEKDFWAILQGFRAQPWNFPGTTYHRAVKSRKKVMKMLGEELEKRKRNKNSTTQEKTNGDLMDGLMQMKDEEGKHLRDGEVIDNILSTIHIGYIGISFAVTWSLYFLAKSPDVLQKLREENIEMKKEKSGEYLTYEDISKLTYTNKVVEETIRLANLSTFIFRKVTEDVEFKGYIIPKGWQVILWLRYLHTDYKNYNNPLCFNPDRWNTRPRYGTYLPFGGGARSCPGNMLARVNLAIYLHHLSTGYKWELVNPDTDIRYLSHPLPADGLEIYLAKI